MAHFTGRADVQFVIGQKGKVSVFVGKGWREAVNFKVEGLDETLMRLLELMRDGVVRVLGFGGR